MEADTLAAAIDGARARAAIAYANLDPAVAAKAMGFSARTLDRVLSGDRPLTIREIRSLAQVTRVPIDFLIHGWDVARNPVEVHLEAIEERLKAMSSPAAAAGDALDRRTAEQLLEHQRASLQAQEELLARVGQSVSKRELEDRRTKDRLQAPQEDAA